jgi:hypothetical protein
MLLQHTEVQKRPYMLHSLRMFQNQFLFPQHAGGDASERHVQADKTRADSKNFNQIQKHMHSRRCIKLSETAGEKIERRL